MTSWPSSPWSRTAARSRPASASIASSWSPWRAPRASSRARSRRSTIEFDNAARPAWTLMRVRGQDAPAFLYALANALAMREIYVHEVRIESQGSRGARRVRDHPPRRAQDRERVRPGDPPPGRGPHQAVHPLPALGPRPRARPALVRPAPRSLDVERSGLAAPARRERSSGPGAAPGEQRVPLGGPPAAPHRAPRPPARGLEAPGPARSRRSPRGAASAARGTPPPSRRRSAASTSSRTRRCCSST